MEHRADTVTHETIALLNKTFITLFDRDEIHQLISSMDDIVDADPQPGATPPCVDVRKSHAGHAAAGGNQYLGGGSCATVSAC